VRKLSRCGADIFVSKPGMIGPS
jgi:hypothetical protein